MKFQTDNDAMRAKKLPASRSTCYGSLMFLISALPRRSKDKIRMNEKTYPVVWTRGTSKKYTDFDQ